MDPAFEQQQRLTGITLKRAFMDRGYRGITEVRGTKIEIPKPFNKSKFFQERIATCDKAIEIQIQQYAAAGNEGEVPVTGPKQTEDQPVSKRKNKRAPKFDSRSYLKSVLGVDVLALYGMSDIGALTILSETGTDMSKWINEKHFVSWLNLCPNNKISGGKLISSMLMKKKPNPASQAFRMAANAVQRSDHWLGEYFRRIKSKGGNKFAIVATANKIATIYYKMVNTRVEFKPLDLQQYQEKRKNAKIAYLEKKLESLKKQTA